MFDLQRFAPYPVYVSINSWNSVDKDAMDYAGYADEFGRSYSDFVHAGYVYSLVDTVPAGEYSNSNIASKILGISNIVTNLYDSNNYPLSVTVMPIDSIGDITVSGSVKEVIINGRSYSVDSSGKLFYTKTVKTVVDGQVVSLGEVQILPVTPSFT